MKKKTILTGMLTLAIAGTTLLSGCGINEDATLVDINNGEDSIALGYGNFVARYTQSMYDMTYLSYMGTDMWTEEKDDTTLEDNVKESVMEAMEEDYLLQKHADDYDIALTDEEKTSIDEAAKKFMEKNSADTLEAMTATEDIVRQYLTNQTYASKVAAAIKESAEVTVTEEEAAQRTFTYAYFGSVTYTDANGNTGYYTDDQKKELKEKAEALTTSADFEKDAEAAGATVQTHSYGADEDTMDEAVIAAADALEEGQISSVVTVDNDGYYVIRLDSAYDEKATADKKESLEDEKRSDYLESVLDGWKDDTTWSVDDKQWDKVKFDTFFQNVTKAEE